MATPIYSTVLRVHQKLKGKWVPAETLSADSGVSEVNKDIINVADTAIFTIGDPIHVFADNQSNGEYKTILAITPDVSFQVDSDMIKDYTTTQNAKVQIRSEFSTRSKPTTSEVEIMINDAEGKIDKDTHHGWREKTKTDTHSIPCGLYYNYYTGVPIHLKKRQVKTLSAGSGDVLEVWDGKDWVDWLATKTEGRENDYWLNLTNGVLYLRQHYFYYTKDAIRITYRYGETTVPEDITRCATLLAAADILDIENYVAHLPGGPDLNLVEVGSKQDKWRKEAEEIIVKHTEMITI